MLQTEDYLYWYTYQPNGIVVGQTKKESPLVAYSKTIGDLL